MNSIQWQAAQDIADSPTAGFFRTMPPDDVHRMVKGLVAEIRRLKAPVEYYEKECGSCDGRGYTVDPTFLDREPCPVCQGRGTLWRVSPPPPQDVSND